LYHILFSFIWLSLLVFHSFFILRLTVYFAPISFVVQCVCHDTYPLKVISTIYYNMSFLNPRKHEHWENELANITTCHVWTTCVVCDSARLWIVHNTRHITNYCQIIENFTSTREINIPGSRYLDGIYSCSYNNCLYICDLTQKVIYRHTSQIMATTNWPVVEDLVTDYQWLIPTYTCYFIWG